MLDLFSKDSICIRDHVAKNDYVTIWNRSRDKLFGHANFEVYVQKLFLWIAE